MAGQSEAAEALREGHEAFNDRDRERLLQRMAEDVTWHSPGDGPTSGTYHGRDDVWENFFAVAWEAPMRLEDHEVIGTDEHATSRTDVIFSLGGEEKRWELIEVARVTDGMVSERWSFIDRQSELDAFMEQTAQQAGVGS